MKNSLTKLLPNVRENFVLASYTTLKVGGPARYLYIAQSRHDILRAVEAALQTQIPFHVLGGGSNTLISDKGFDGLLIILRNHPKRPWRFEVLDSERMVVGEAGMPTGSFALHCAQRSLGGFEWMQGIPGTIGGAIYGNAGSFGKSMKEVVLSVEILDVSLPFPCVRVISNQECSFAYRDSVFKQTKKFIILSAVFSCVPGDPQQIRERLGEYMQYRKEHQPLEHLSCASIFKNCRVEELDQNRIEKLPDIQNAMRYGFVSSGYLIEKVGCTGMKVGNAMVSPKHANFIVNCSQATAQDIFELSEKVKEKVHERFGIELEREIQLVGDFKSN